MNSLRPRRAALSFVLTLFSLLVPAAILVAVTIDRHMLTQKTLVATEQRASEVAKVTSERVIAVDDRLRLIAAILAARDEAHAEVEDLARTVFHAVAQIEDAGHFTRVAGPNLIAPALRETVLTQLACDAAADLVTTTLDGKMRIMLARKTSMPAVNGVLMAELNPGWQRVGHFRAGASAEPRHSRLLQSLISTA